MGLRDGYRVETSGTHFALRRVSIGRIGLGAVLALVALAIGEAARRGALHVADGSPFPLWITGLAVCATGLPALALILYRSGITVDGARGSVVTWWGLGSLCGIGNWRRTERHALDALDHVTVSKEVRSNGGNGGSRTVYVVRLIGEPLIHVLTFSSPLPARQLAERLAQATNRPLRSTLVGEAVVTAPERLDWSLRERLIADGDVPEEPTQPPRSRLRVHADGARRVIAVPAPGMLRAGLGLAALALPGEVAALGLAISFFGDASPAVLAVIVAVVLAPLAVVVALVAPHGLRRTRVEITPDTLRVEHAWPWRRELLHMEVAVLEELSETPIRKHPFAGLVLQGGVTAISDNAFLQLTRGLSEPDQTYLATLVRHVVCQPSDHQELPAELRADPAWATL